MARTGWGVAMPLILPEGYPLENSFRMAGFLDGRPIGDNPNGQGMALSWNLLKGLFHDTHLNMLIDDAGIVVPLPTSPDPSQAFDIALAAEILEACVTARITPIGRLLETTEGHIGNAQVAFDSADNVIRMMLGSIRRLRANAVKERGDVVIPATP